MSKILKIFIIMLFIAAISLGATFAATEDTFTITVTCNFLAINLRTYNDGADYTTWAIGQVALNTPTTMTEAQGVKLVNTSNAATDIQAKGTDTAGWTLAGSAGADQYKLEIKSFDATQGSPDLSTGTTVLTTSYQTFKSTLAAVTNQWFYNKLTTPTSNTATGQQSVTVSIQCILH